MESTDDYIFSMEWEMEIIKEYQDFCISENQMSSFFLVI
jgi:hypothetical protein